MVWYILLFVVLLWGLGNLFTALLQDYFIFRPQRLSEDYRFAFAHACEEIWVPDVAHGRIHGLWFRRSGARGVVMYCHGNSGSVARWGHLYHFFFRFNYDFFVYDYRGYGKSRGRRSQELLYEDALSVYRFLEAQYGEARIVLFGRSLGSAFASFLAGRRRPRLLILETPFASMVKLFFTYYPFLPPVFWFKYRFNNRKHLRNTRCPVLILQGTNDLVVPLRCAGELSQELKPRDEFVTIEKGRHNDLIIYDIYNQKIAEFLERL